MDEIKEAFQRVKHDIDYLNQEIEYLRLAITEMNWSLSKLQDEIRNLKQSIKRPILKPISTPKLLKKQEIESSTHPPTSQTPSAHPSTHDTPFKALKTQNLSISTGNQGVPADRQTNRQTNRHIEIEPKIPLQQPIQQDIFKSKGPALKTQELEESKSLDPIHDAAKILDSLDALKKEIRLKFKRLTEKEILVFSTLYQVEEEEGHGDYKAIAAKLGLTESSIRDYIARLISKGIPVEKNRINNKTIQLNISDSLKKVASLATILQLRDL